jgi:Ca-activated chloride channel family protein
MIHNLTFQYPYVFILILIYILCIKFCKQKRVAFLFPNQELLQKASIKSRYGIAITKFLLFICLLFAIASPVVENNIITLNDKGYEISLILDTSGSMKERNKFAIVKNIVTKFINKRKHDKLALSIFADFAYVAVPLTYDKKSIKRLLSKINVGVAGVQKTALYEALFLSSNLFKTSNAKEKIAILLTDGIDNTGTIPLQVAINTTKKYGIKVYTIGIGNVGDFNPDILNKIAKDTGGKFFSANSIEKLQEIYKTINKLEKSEIKTNKYVKKTYYFQYPLLISLVFLILYFYLVNKE